MKTMATKRVLLGAVLMLALAGCSAPAKPPAGQPAAAVAQPVQVTKIEVDQLAAMLEDKDFTFVNVHIPYEGLGNPLPRGRAVAGDRLRARLRLPLGRLGQAGRHVKSIARRFMVAMLSPSPGTMPALRS